MLTYQTAGESHGKGLSALVDGFPAGVPIDFDFINNELRRRQGGYGRGGRQKIETDQVEVLSGILHGKSMGSPIMLWVKNKDYKIETMPSLFQPRPGHGDLTGSIKYMTEIRTILERASARETAARVAAGALAQVFLRQLGIQTAGYVVSIGPLMLNRSRGSNSDQTSTQTADQNSTQTADQNIDQNIGSDRDRANSFVSEEIDQMTYSDLIGRRDASDVYSLFPDRDEEAHQLIDRCRDEGDTLGGVIEVRVFNLPMGIGTHAQWSRKLDGRLAQAAMAVQAIKGVEIGLGFEAARRMGSQVHDPIHYNAGHADHRDFGYERPTNFAGGLEAGMTNGQPLIVRAAMKPIATLRKPLDSVNTQTKEPIAASYERSDVCAISAASVVLENVIAFEVASALVNKFGGDSLFEVRERIALFQKLIREDYPFFL